MPHQLSPPDMHKMVGVVFMSDQAREVDEAIHIEAGVAITLAAGKVDDQGDWSFSLTRKSARNRAQFDEQR